MLYRIELWAKNPDPTERGFVLARSEVCGSLQTARLTAEQWLPEQAETTHSARFARYPWVEVTRVKRFRSLAMKASELRSCGKVETIDTPIRHVTSVGEFGYTP